MTATDDTGTVHLLVVEDNPTDRSWLVMMLDGADLCRHSLAYAETLATAEVMLHDDAFDCVLLDLRLPDGDGVESVRRIVTAAPQTPIVVFTGRTEQELGLQSIEAGAQDYLVKGQVTGNVILRAARWAAARHHAVADSDLDAVLDRVRGPWARLDADLRIRRTSPSFARLVGWDHAALPGTPLTALAGDPGAERAEAPDRLDALAAPPEADEPTIVEVVVAGHPTPLRLVAVRVAAGPGANEAADVVVVGLGFARD